MNCPNCAKEIKDEDSVYCPYCRRFLREMPFKTTGLPIAGGILAILASCITCFIAVSVIAAFLGNLSIYLSVPPFYGMIFLGMFGIVAFALGLAGGITSLTRKNFAPSIVGICFSILQGFIIVIVSGTVGDSALRAGFLLGLPIIALSILGLIFVAISKAEFT